MHIFPSWKIWEGWKNFFSFQIFFSNVKGLATRILIDPCEEEKYSGQTQAHIYSQILGLGLEIDIRDGHASSIYVIMGLPSYLSMVVKGGFEPLPY